MTSAPPLTRDAIRVGELYTRAQVAGLLKLAVKTLSLARWKRRLGPVRLGGALLYPGERLIAYLESVGLEPLAPAKPRRPLTPGQLQERVRTATARGQAARGRSAGVAG